MTELVDIKQRRKFEQQEFVRSLAERVREAADEMGKYPMHIFDVVADLHAHLRTSIDIRAVGSTFGPTPMKATRAHQIIVDILHFKRVDSETDYLVWKLILIYINTNADNNIIFFAENSLG